MSERWQTWAMAQRTGSPLCKLVLLALAWHARNDGRGVAGWQFLADQTEMALAQLQLALGELESCDLIYASLGEHTVQFRLRVER